MSSIEISDTHMVADSGHTADYDRDAWVVSWCPALRLDRNRAVTALIMTEFATTGVTSSTHKKWPFMKGWAAELGMDANEAVRMILGATS